MHRDLLLGVCCYCCHLFFVDFCLWFVDDNWLPEHRLWLRRSLALDLSLEGWDAHRINTWPCHRTTGSCGHADGWTHRGQSGGRTTKRLADGELISFFALGNLGGQVTSPTNHFHASRIPPCHEKLVTEQYTAIRIFTVQQKLFFEVVQSYSLIYSYSINPQKN